MSKITKKTIDLKNVKYTLDNGVFTTTNGKSVNSVNIPENIIVNIDKDILSTTIENDEDMPLCGTINRLINNAVMGVKKPYEVELRLVGIGYKCIMAGNKLTFNVGCSHAIDIQIPDNIEVQVKTPVQLLLKSINKQSIGDFKSKLTKGVRKYNPYSGKGILVKDVIYPRKETKKK